MKTVVGIEKGCHAGLKELARRWGTSASQDVRRLIAASVEQSGRLAAFCGQAARTRARLIGMIARPLPLGSCLVLAIAGCQADRQDERALITDPQFAVVNPVDSLAPLYEMDNPNRLPGRYIVRFEPGVADPRALAEQIVAGRGGGRVYEVLRGLKGFWGELPDGAIEGLRRNRMSATLRRMSPCPSRAPETLPSCPPAGRSTASTSGRCRSTTPTTTPSWGAAFASGS
ncbi:MAG: hypothetical protein ABIV11_10330 [Gemmatimonadaceae bacterium]